MNAYTYIYIILDISCRWQWIFWSCLRCKFHLLGTILAAQGPVAVPRPRLRDETCYGIDGPFTYKQWWFSIAMLIKLPDGNLSDMSSLPTQRQTPSSSQFSFPPLFVSVSLGPHANCTGSHQLGFHWNHSTPLDSCWYRLVHVFGLLGLAAGICPPPGLFCLADLPALPPPYPQPHWQSSHPPRIFGPLLLLPLWPPPPSSSVWLPLHSFSFPLPPFFAFLLPASSGSLLPLLPSFWLPLLLLLLSSSFLSLLLLVFVWLLLPPFSVWLLLLLLAFFCFLPPPFFSWLLLLPAAFRLLFFLRLPLLPAARRWNPNCGFPGSLDS